MGTDGASSFVRRYCNIQMISEGAEFACGVAYKIKRQVDPGDEPLHQALNCVLTVSQTRYLVNSSTSRSGYLNIRLIQNEYDTLREDLKKLQDAQSQNEPMDLSDTDKFPNSPVWNMIRQGLYFFKIKFKYVVRVVPIEINVRHASIAVRELRFEVKRTEHEIRNHEGKKYRTALAFLAGDAAMNVHFWPGRGMNSGMKAAMALARNILRSCTVKNSIQIRRPLRFLDFLDYESFMARLRAREQQGRSLRVLIDPIGQFIEASHSYAYTNHCYRTYKSKLLDKLTEIRERLQRNGDWPHKSRLIKDEELQSAVNRISPEVVAQLTLANPWPTREMSGADVLVEHVYPFDLKKFKPIPEKCTATPGFRPAIRTPHRIIILWIVSDREIESVDNMIRNIEISEEFARPSGNTQTSYQQNVVQTIEDAKQWIRTKKESLREAGVIFKIITLWTPGNAKSAIDVIVAVRSEFSQVPVLVFLNSHEEPQSLSEFTNITLTDKESDIREFVGIDQRNQLAIDFPRSDRTNIESSRTFTTSKLKKF